MIAVKALYREGEIEFLEPPPVLLQAPVIVVFLDAGRIAETLAPMIEQMDIMNWGDPMDEEGARLLVALHEELAPYRIEANRTWEREIEE